MDAPSIVTTAAPDIGDARAKLDEDAVGVTSREVFTEYESSSNNLGGRPHPADVAEAASLAATPTPRADYPLRDSLPSSLIEEGKLSCLQLESVALACAQHLRILPTTPPSRRGFFLGDGAGVGKGRQLAGMLFDNLVRGRPQHLWLSTSTDLLQDALRDIPVHDGCIGLDKATRGLGASKEVQGGVLFCTYATLVSSGSKSKGQSRLHQLVSWCGGAGFDGCIFFDESHKAKNFTGKEETSSKVAQAVLELQRALPLARVVYCSATGASDLSNMAYMERLGLWGTFSPFADFDTFVGAITRRGVGGLEMLAMEMKATGSYVSRGLSYKDAEFDLVTATLSPTQRASFDAAAVFWSGRLAPEMRAAATRTNVPVGALMRSYWGAHQRFFKQLCICFKIDALVARVQEALDAGHCAIVGLQSTGEAALERAMSADGANSAMVSLCKMMLLGFVEHNFPTKLAPDQRLAKEMARAEQHEQTCQEELLEARAKAVTAGRRGAFELQTAQQATALAERLLADARAALLQLQALAARDGATDDAVDNESLVQRARLLQEIHTLDLPDGALDSIIDRLGGVDKVAEMTGRKSRMVRQGKGRRFSLQPRAKPDSGEMELLNVRERNAFMEGKKLVAIISDAASTGISLQADRRVANQRRRVHITLELAWSADKAVQQLGRSHRANQVSAPLYVLLTSDVGGESRFASAVARRLAAMGALTKGDRRAEIGALDTFNFETPWGKKALKSMLAAAFEGVSPMPHLHAAVTSDRGDAIRDALRDLGADDVREREKLDVKKFLNRLLGLKLLPQGLLFGLFVETLEAVIATARRDGRYDEGMADVTGSTVSVEDEEKTLWRDPVTGAHTQTVALVIDRGLSFLAAKQKLGELKKSAAQAANAVGTTTEEYADGGGGGDNDDQDDHEDESDDEDGSDDDMHLAGFYRSRFLQGGATKIFILAIPKANDTRNKCILWRPNTGRSPFEEDWSELFRKYELVTEEEAQGGWEAAYDAAAHHDVGGRFSRLQLLTGSTLPLLPLLEDLVTKHAGVLSRRESAISAVRVQLADRRLVGVRFPRSLLDPLKASLFEWLTVRGGADRKLRVEQVADVDEKARAKAMRPLPTMRSFFQPAGKDLPPTPKTVPGTSSTHSKHLSAHVPSAGRQPQVAQGAAQGIQKPDSRCPVPGDDVVDLLSDSDDDNDGGNSFRAQPPVAAAQHLPMQAPVTITPAAKATAALRGKSLVAPRASQKPGQSVPPPGGPGGSGSGAGKRKSILEMLKAPPAKR